MAEDHDLVYRPTRLLVASMAILFCANAILHVVSVWSEWSQIQLIAAAKTRSISDGEVVANDLRQILVGGLLAVDYIALVVLFCVWIFRANRDARALGAVGMRFTPGWCVGWFFVPVMNLFRPYQAVVETWKASGPGDATPWQQRESSSLLGVWWTIWMVSNFLWLTVVRCSLSADYMEELLVISWLAVVSDLVDVLLAIVAASVVRDVHDRQQSTYRRMLARDAGPRILPALPDAGR